MLPKHSTTWLRCCTRTKLITKQILTNIAFECWVFKVNEKCQNTQIAWAERQQGYETAHLRGRRNAICPAELARIKLRKVLMMVKVIGAFSDIKKRLRALTPINVIRSRTASPDIHSAEMTPGDKFLERMSPSIHSVFQCRLNLCLIARKFPRLCLPWSPSMFPTLMHPFFMWRFPSWHFYPFCQITKFSLVHNISFGFQWLLFPAYADFQFAFNKSNIAQIRFRVLVDGLTSDTQNPMTSSTNGNEAA